MILDDKLIMADSDDLASISASSTSIIGDVLNLGTGTGAWGNTKTPDIGEGSSDLEFCCICEDEAFTSNGSPSIDIHLCTADDESLSTNATNIISKLAIVKATGVDGARLLHAKIPPGVLRQYVGTKVKAGTAALTAGFITSWINMGVDSTIGQKT